MNGDQEQNLFKSMKINSLTNIPNYLNSLQFISMDIQNNDNNINNEFEDLKKEIQNNGQPPQNILNLSENELFNYELDQSSESIMTNQSFSQQMPFDYPSKNNNINNYNHIENKINSSAFKSNDKNTNLKYNNNNIKNNETINTLEEKLRQETLKNNELKNYIEILKQTINSTLLQKKNLPFGGLDTIPNESNKSKIDILTEYT